MTKELDFLARTAIDALQKFSDMPESWIAGKARDFEGLDRLAVLREFSSFDELNLEVVSEYLGISHSDMLATLRVLQKI